MMVKFEHPKHEMSPYYFGHMDINEETKRDMKQ
jgi:hypothetical protein